MGVILADRREGILPALVAAMGDVIVPVDAEWDYTVVGKAHIVAVERKGGMDLLSSMSDGRLYEQARAMVESPASLALLVFTGLLEERNGRAVVDGVPSAWNYDAVLMQLVSLAAVGVAPVHVPAYRFAKFLASLMSWCDRAEHFRPRRRRSALEAIDRRVAVLDVLVPGLGPKKAATVLSHFGSLRQALGNIPKWAELPGIGPKIVQAAEEAWAEGEER